MTHPWSAIRVGEPSDLLAWLPLLRVAGLPTEDFLGAAARDFWVVESEGSLIGAIGLERFGKSALLRSLIVAPGHQRHGLGRQLVARLERDAQGSGINQLVLLTETAETFFAGLGYAVVARQCVPEAVKQSAEFRSLCPASAVCMTKSLSTQLVE